MDVGDGAVWKDGKAPNFVGVAVVAENAIGFAVFWVAKIDGFDELAVVEVVGEKFGAVDVEVFVEVGDEAAVDFAAFVVAEE